MSMTFEQVKKFFDENIAMPFINEISEYFSDKIDLYKVRDRHFKSVDELLGAIVGTKPTNFKEFSKDNNLPERILVKVS
jgi:hypothetical protein